MAERVIDALDGAVEGKTVGLLGVTFKAGTDDMRESPALTVVPALQARGARVQAYDPEGMAQAASMLPDVDWADDPYAALQGADVAVLMTEWPVFRALDLAQVHAALKSPVVVDLRNLYDTATMEKAGFRYISIGRHPVG